MTIPTDPIIGVDVGASTISAGLVCPDGTVLATAQAPTQGGGAVVATILSLIDRALVSAEERGLRVSGIGVGLPGLVDVEKGFMRSMPFAWLTDLGDVPLAALIRERSGLPVFVDNDVNALALAEWTFGLGRGASSLVTVAIGTGMGAGLILDGRLVRGHLHGAGEIGHLAVGLTGPACVCGGVGCLATYVAGGMIAERARERLNRYPDSAVLARAGGDPERINAVVLFEAAAGGDPLARAVVEEACEALAMGIGALVNLLNPEVIVITGGVAASLAPLQDDILRRVRRRALAAALDATTVHVVPADKRGTVRGGAALVLYEMARRGQDIPSHRLPSRERAG
ncbi:MAG: ROK family protein [Candidatus Rokuibacteriota bacterium]